MLKKSFIMGLCLALVFSFFTPANNDLQAADNPYQPPSEDWNKLQDFMIFDNPSHIDGYNWGMTWEISNDHSYNEKSSLQLAIEEEWGRAYLAVNGWQTANLLDYHENGTLEFNIKGENGGERIMVGFQDVVTERVYQGELVNSGQSSEEIVVSLDGYVDVTTDWQYVSIPLADFIDLEGIFDISKIQLFTVHPHAEDITVYLNDIKVVSPDTERIFPPIKVNQIGYIINSEKYAYVSGFYNVLDADVGTSFQVRNASNDNVVYSGELSLVAAYDPASGEKVFKADFSSFNQPGKYYITVSGIEERSAAFKIGNDIFDSFLKDVQRFFFLQRANLELSEEHAGIYARDALHMVDANLPIENTDGLTKDVSGGWYDAGDFGKYITAGATAVSELLWTYEMFPHIFYDGQMNIPESGNGNPDLIDEIKYELDFLLKMQDEASGGFYSYVIRDEAPDRRIMNRSDNRMPTAQTANTVGVLAHAAVVYKDIPGLEAYAQTLLDAAIAGWQYLEANPNHIAQPSGPYDTDDNTRGRFYAASSLYRATEEQKYNEYVLANYQSLGSVFNDSSFSHGINGMEMMGYMLYLSADQYNQEVMDWFIPNFNSWRDSLINTINNDAVWRNAPNNFYWGANTNVLNVNLTNMVGSKIIGDFKPEITETAIASLNYILGINPLQLSYVTGFGENHVLETHSSIFNTDGIIGMPNGFMPGGANGWDNRKISQFPGKAYNHSTIDWVSNEHAINYNAPLVFVAALLVAEANSTKSVSAQPINHGTHLSIANDSIYSLQYGGTLTIPWGASIDEVKELRLTKAQVKELAYRQITILIQKDDIILEVPFANFDGSEDVSIFMERVTDTTDLAQADKAKGAIYQLTIQVGQEIYSQFEYDLTISFPIDPENVENPEQLKVYYWSAEQGIWEQVGGTYADGYVTTKTDHFSIFTVFDPSIFVEEDDDQDNGTPPNGDVDVEDPPEEDTTPPSVESPPSTVDPVDEDKDGKELPKTASQVYTILLLGGLLLATGLVVFFRRLRQTTNA